MRSLPSHPLLSSLTALAAVLAACVAPPLHAQAVDLAAAAAPRGTDPALYQALGGRFGIDRLVDDFVQRLLRDPRMRPFFEEADLPNLRLRLAEQFCVVSGGPCTYGGKDMKKVHEGVDIDKADFNAMVEVLQQSMDARAIPFAAQNRLLAKLAPMHREVINK